MQKMKKRMRISLFLTAVLSAVTLQATAEGFKTAGNGTTYTMKKLLQTEEAGVKTVNTASESAGYLLTQNDTIAEGDFFVMDDDVRLEFADGVALVLEGEADFRLTKGSTFDMQFDPMSDREDWKPVGLVIRNSKGIEITNATFFTVGIQSMTKGDVTLRNCRFYGNNGVNAAALYFTSAAESCTVENCLFERCNRAAIGSAANASQPMTIRNCTFTENSTDNRNIPQINITAASDIRIEDCQLTGYEENTMVGGIGISNFMSYEDTHALVSRCEITDNRYGITTFGPTDIRIEDCRLTDNNHETNPMNGGSGISLYDPYGKTTAVIAGNEIERNLWGVTVIGCKEVSLGEPTSLRVASPGGNVFKDNGFDGERYDLYNNSTLTIYAQNNTWSVISQTEEEIESVIFHKHDDERLGEVIFMPAAEQTGIREIEEWKDSERIFNLRGMQMDTCPQRGFYIRNGKKYLR